jgi:cation diffusion facilitator family transporter
VPVPTTFSGASGYAAAVADEQSEGSARTVIVAEAANLTIAIAKIVAALLTGSASMAAEAAHSVADTGNELLLYIGLRRSSKGPDERHPFGYGQERYFWAFLAALGIFLVGGALSIAEGVRSLLSPEPVESLVVGIGVLVVSACFEGISWHTARKQLREGARQRRRSITQQLRRASDPSATTVFLEDSAALTGIAIALAALILHAVTGSAIWDAAGSIIIGVLLIVVAGLLARRSKALLLDESAPPDILEPIRERLSAVDWVGDLCDLQAVYVGPSQLLVNVWVTPANSDELSAGELTRQVGDLRASLMDVPAIAQATVTLADPGTRATPAGPGGSRPRP